MDQDIKKVYFKIIQKHFSNIAPEEIKLLFGNDHWIFVTREVAFRFPKVPRKIDTKRSKFLKQFVPMSPIDIPIIEVCKDIESGINYEVNKFIPGVSLYPELAKTFTKDELGLIAKKLGGFLSAVHSFPIEKARKLKLDEMNPNDFWEYMEQNPKAFPEYKKRVFSYISSNEQVWVEKLFKDYIELIKKKPFTTKVTHSDMWTYHIIVDADVHTLSGVIDFWGRIADPANDFKAFEYYGDDFVKEVYKNYILPKDDDFDKRRLFYTGHDEVFELARQIKLRNKEKILKYKNSLSGYIIAHPI